MTANAPSSPLDDQKISRLFDLIQETRNRLNNLRTIKDCLEDYPHAYGIEFTDAAYEAAMSGGPEDAAEVEVEKGAGAEGPRVELLTRTLDGKIAPYHLGPVDTAPLIAALDPWFIAQHVGGGFLMPELKDAIEDDVALENLYCDQLAKAMDGRTVSTVERLRDTIETDSVLDSVGVMDALARLNGAREAMRGYRLAATYLAEHGDVEALRVFLEDACDNCDRQKPDVELLINGEWKGYYSCDFEDRDGIRLYKTLNEGGFKGFANAHDRIAFTRAELVERLRITYKAATEAVADLVGAYANHAAQKGHEL